MKQSIIILFAALLATAALADDSKARVIMEKVDARDDGKTMRSDMEMILIDKNGNKRERVMKRYAKDMGEDTYTIMFFLSPSDVKDTAFLTYDYDAGEKDDDQWLYLPALKKTKRIPSTDKSGSFMGSDFTYSDMTERDLADYDFKLLKELDDRGHKAWLIQSKPRSKKVQDETGYLSSLVIVRQDNYVVTRAIHTLERKGWLKYFEVKTLEKINGIWQATEMTMTTKNGKMTDHSTIIRHHDVIFNEPMSDEIFTTRTLERGL